MRPSFHLKSETPNTKNKASPQSQLVAQTWQRSGRCPNGTIPIRRITRQDLLRASSLEKFGKKAPPPSHRNNATSYLPNDLVYINNTNVSLPTLSGRSVSEILINYFNIFLSFYLYIYIRRHFKTIDVEYIGRK